MFREQYRQMNDRIHADERLVQRTLYAVRPQKKAPVMRRVLALTMVMLLCLTIGTSALAATVPEFNSWLYTIAPDVALYFRPVRMADENNGVRMEVEAIRISGREAQIYVTVTDLEGGRLDDTVDLFDSYSIDLPGHSGAYCQKVRYDEETNSTTFLIRYTSAKEINQDKLTFKIRHMLTQKKNSAAHIYPQDYAPFDGEAESIMPGNLVRGGGFSDKMMNEYGLSNAASWTWHGDLEQLPVLKPESISVELAEGVRLTGVGYVDGMLHIQLHYDDIIVTDNHGFTELDTASGEKITEYMSVAFWDDAHTGSYEDYVFDVAPDKLQGVRLVCRFVTCKSLVEGPWSVTFPITEIP